MLKEHFNSVVKIVFQVNKVCVIDFPPEKQIKLILPTIEDDFQMNHVTNIKK